MSIWVITDRDSFYPIKTGLTLASELRKLYPNQWETKSLNRLLADTATRNGILAANSADQLLQGYKSELNAFKRRRERFLIYR